VILTNVFVSVPISIKRRIVRYLRPTFPYIARVRNSILSILRYFIRPSWERAVIDASVALKNCILCPRVPHLVRVMNLLMVCLVVAMYAMIVIWAPVLVEMGGWVGSLSLIAFGALIFYFKVYSHRYPNYDAVLVDDVNVDPENDHDCPHDKREGQVVNPDLLLFLIVSFATMSLLKLDGYSDAFFGGFERMIFSLQPLEEYLDSISLWKVIFIYITAIVSWIFGQNLFFALDEDSILGYSFVLPKLSRRSTMVVLLSLPGIVYGIGCLVGMFNSLATLPATTVWNTIVTAVLGVSIAVLAISGVFFVVWYVLAAILTQPKIIRYILDQMGILDPEIPNASQPGSDNGNPPDGRSPPDNGGPPGNGGPPDNGSDLGSDHGSTDLDDSDHGGDKGRVPIEAEVVEPEPAVVMPTTDEANPEIPIDGVFSSDESEDDESSGGPMTSKSANQALEDAKANLEKLRQEQRKSEAKAARYEAGPEIVTRPLQRAPGLSQIPEESEPSSSRENKPKPQPGSGREIKDSQESHSSLDQARSEAMTTERPEGRFGHRPDDSVNSGSPPKSSSSKDAKPGGVNLSGEVAPFVTIPIESEAPVEPAPPVENSPPARADEKLQPSNTVEHDGNAKELPTEEDIKAQKKADKKAKRAAEKAEKKRQEAEQLKITTDQIKNDPDLNEAQKIDILQQITPRPYHYDPDTTEAIWDSSSDSSESTKSPPATPRSGNETAVEETVVEKPAAEEAAVPAGISPSFLKFFREDMRQHGQSNEEAVESGPASDPPVYLTANEAIDQSIGSAPANAAVDFQSLREIAQQRGESNDVAVKSSPISHPTVRWAFHVESDSPGPPADLLVENEVTVIHVPNIADDTDPISPLRLPRNIQESSSSSGPPIDVLVGNEPTRRRLSELALSAPQAPAKFMEVNDEERWIPATAPEDRALKEKSSGDTETESFESVSHPVDTKLSASSLERRPKADAMKIDNKVNMKLAASMDGTALMEKAFGGAPEEFFQPVSTVATELPASSLKQKSKQKIEKVSEDTALMERAFEGSRSESFEIISKPVDTELPASSLRKKQKALAPQH